VIELLLHAERALSVGMLDRAETLYRQVAAADPRNSIAFVGLSRVALDRGDELEALELARQGLALDPENNAAQRMVQRLEEIIDYRLEVEGPIMPARPDLDEALGTAAETETEMAEPDEATEAEADQSEAEPTTEASGEGEAKPVIEVEPEPETPSEAEAALDAVIVGWEAELESEPAPAMEGEEPVATEEPPEAQPEASPDPWANASPPPWAPTDSWPTPDPASGTPLDPWRDTGPAPDLPEGAGASADAATSTPPPATYEDDGPRRSWFDRLFRRER
jgi:hypothetical protein